MQFISKIVWFWRLFLWDIRVIRKVRQTQHQNPEFSHTQGEIKEKPAKKYISIQQETLNFNSKLSFILSFLFLESLHCYYLYNCYNYFDPCALNAKFQHFVLSYSISYCDLIKCLYFADTTERGDRGVKGGPKTGLLYG
jgi:hypothetical protein